MDDDGPVGELPAARSHAHKLPSIVGKVHDVAGDHLVAPGYLIFDYQAALGEGGLISSDPRR